MEFDPVQDLKNLAINLLHMYYYLLKIVIVIIFITIIITIIIIIIIITISESRTSGTWTLDWIDLNDYF